jgi:MFS family permease
MKKTNQDAFAVSMISVAEYAPMFVFSFIGGVFADRWRPKRTVVWCDLLSSFSVFLVFLVLEAGSWKAVFIATLCSSILSQFAAPSGMKLFKAHVCDEDAPACMSFLQTLVSVFMIIGPIMGTWAYEQLGIGLALALTGVCFLFSAAAMLFIPPDPNAYLNKNPSAKASLFREMADGIRYVIVSKELIGCLGFRRPKKSRIGFQSKNGLSKPRTLQSPDVTVVAWTLISNSFARGTGFSTSP